MTLKRRAPLCALLLALAGPTPSSAQTSSFTEEDWAALPQYCQVRLRGDDAAKKGLSHQIGEAQYIHLHHHCFGLYFMNKAMVSVSKRKKNEFLGEANNEFGYVARSMPPASPLRAEALQYQQQIKMMIRP